MWVGEKSNINNNNSRWIITSTVYNMAGEYVSSTNYNKINNNNKYW